MGLFGNKKTFEEQYESSKRLSIMLNERFSSEYTEAFDGDIEFRGKAK